MDKEQAVKQIRTAMRQNGPYTNNVIGSVLRLYATDNGYEAADALIKEMKLGRLYGIMTETERQAEIAKREKSRNG